MSRSWKSLFTPLLAAGLLVGCKGYHFGPVREGMAPGRTLAVLPFVNQTMMPRLGDAVTEAVREEVQADGTYHLKTRGDADLVVNGTLTHYGREALSFLTSDSYTPDNYRVGVVAHVVARERSTGHVLFEKDVKGFTLLHVGTDLNSADLQTQNLLAEDLAHNVLEQLSEGGW